MFNIALSFCTGQYSSAIFKDLAEICPCREQVNKKYILGFLFSCVADTDLSQTMMSADKWAAKSVMKKHDRDSRVW